MDKRPSGYYWVRWHEIETIAQWMEVVNIWFAPGVGMALTHESVEVLYGPIPGPEELAAMAKDRERLDWLESDLRSTGRGSISLHPHDYNCPRVANLRADWEFVPGEDHRCLNWPDTQGRATGIREAIDAAIAHAPPGGEKRRSSARTDWDPEAGDPPEDRRL